jgi:hypothetical protein
MPAPQKAEPFSGGLSFIDETMLGPVHDHKSTLAGLPIRRYRSACDRRRWTLLRCNLLAERRKDSERRVVFSGKTDSGASLITFWNIRPRHQFKKPPNSHSAD